MAKVKLHAAAVRVSKLMCMGALTQTTAEIITTAYKPLVEAAQLCQGYFARNHTSGNFQGDDEHEAWTSIDAALQKVVGP